MKLFLISSDNKAPDLYDRLKYFIIVMHLEIVLFENSCFIISVVRRFTWWVIHLTGNICGYFSFTSFFAATIVEALSETTEENLLHPTSSITFKISFEIKSAVWKYNEKSFSECIYSLPIGKIKIKA